jgi:hypothetical protein
MGQGPYSLGAPTFLVFGLLGERVGIRNTKTPAARGGVLTFVETPLQRQAAGLPSTSGRLFAKVSRYLSPLPALPLLALIHRSA